MAIQETFVVTARKWRPQQFSDVVGQEHITKTLKNAITGNRVHHAYLFSGPRGVGKTTTARIFARGVNCVNLKNGEPCNECENCLNMLENKSMDIIEIDGASNNSVDDIRKLRENAKYPPITGKFKLYIIDEVHMLSTSAFNALLKTLEEPPPHLLFVFATTESHKVPATILSRCQRFDFRRMEITNITNQLKYIAEKESITIDEQSLVTIAKKADGSMRDSQSIFDQVIAFCGKDVNYSDMAESLHLIDEEFFFELTDAISNNDKAEIFNISKKVSDKGYDLNETLSGYLEHVRNLMSVKATESTDLIETSEEYKEKYLKYSEKFTDNDLLSMMKIVNDAEQQIRFSSQPKIKFELSLLKMASLEKVQDLNLLLSQIAELKKNSNWIGNSSDEPKQVIQESKKEIKKTSILDVVENTVAKPQKSLKSEIQNKWNDFKNSDELIDLGLSELKNTFAEIYDDYIILKPNSEFLYNFFNENREKVRSLFNNKFDLKINIDFVYDKNQPIKEVSNKFSKEVTSNSKIEDDTELSDLEKAIIKELGAIKIK